MQIALSFAWSRNSYKGCRDQSARKKMERETTSLKQQYCCTAVMNVISSLFSVASLAFCILLSVQTSAITDRVLDLETGHGEQIFHRVPSFSVDQFNSLIQERVDELLSQVSITSTWRHACIFIYLTIWVYSLSIFNHVEWKTSRPSLCFWSLFKLTFVLNLQRSYEHFAKIRIARQVSPSPDCNCPPGKSAFNNALNRHNVLLTLYNNSDKVAHRKEAIL